MRKTCGEKERPSDLELWLQKQLGHPGEYIKLSEPEIIFERYDHFDYRFKNKHVRPLSQNLSYQTYYKLKNQDNNWGTIYRELTGFEKIEEKNTDGFTNAKDKIKFEDPPYHTTVKIDNRPVKYIGGAIRRYKNTNIRKEGSSTGISGRDLFNKRSEIDYSDLIQEAWEALYNLAGKHDPDKGSFSAYIYQPLKWKIHQICKDPGWRENEQQHYAQFKSYSDRSQSYNKLAAQLGEDAFSENFYEKLYREQAREGWDADIKDSKSGGFNGSRPFDSDTGTDDFNLRFQIALEEDLTDRQEEIINLQRRGYKVKSGTETDIVDKLRRDPNFNGIGRRQVLREKRDYEKILREKFPEKVREPYDGENLENWDIYTSKETLLEHLKEVEKRQKKSERIEAGYSFGKWPKDGNGYPILATKSKSYEPDKSKIPETK